MIHITKKRSSAYLEKQQLNFTYIDNHIGGNNIKHTRFTALTNYMRCDSIKWKKM